MTEPNKSGMKPGMTYQRTITVDDGRAISFMGDDLRVYATPHVVSDLEYACRDFIKEHLPEGQDSVGSHVEIRHLKPTPMGCKARHKMRRQRAGSDVKHRRSQLAGDLIHVGDH